MLSGGVRPHAASSPWWDSTTNSPENKREENAIQSERSVSFFEIDSTFDSADLQGDYHTQQEAIARRLAQTDA